MLLENKNALIYGGGGAIGGAVARVFAREGARVFIAGRTQARLDAVARHITAAGGSIETAQVDVLDERATEKHAGAVAAIGGEIDIALNAVGFLHDQGTQLADLSLAAYMHPIEKFLRSLFITSKAVAAHMGKKQPGTILTLTAPAAKMAVPGHLGHTVSCAGIEAFSRALAAELALQNVRANLHSTSRRFGCSRSGLLHPRPVRTEGQGRRPFSVPMAPRRCTGNHAQTPADLGRRGRDRRIPGL